MPRSFGPIATGRCGLFPDRPGLRRRGNSSGQRAAPGAIERVRIDPVTLEPKYRIIGVDNGPTKKGSRSRPCDRRHRICGSAIIEWSPRCISAGIISEDGVIDGAVAARSPRIFQNGRTFPICCATASRASR